MSTIDVLRGVPLFSGMTDLAIESIAGMTRETAFADGAEIVHEGDEADTFIVLIDGSARVDRGGHPIRDLGRGDFLGEMSLLDGGRRTATVTALEPVSALVVSRSDFRRLIDDFAAVRYDILSALSQRVRRDASDGII